MKGFLQETKCIAFPIRPALNEIDYRNNSSDLDKRLADILDAAECVMNIRTDFDLQ